MATNKRLIKSNDEGAGGASFNTVVYSGDGTSSQPITGVGFQPDLVWIKERTSTGWHILFDSLRGANKAIYSNDIYIEESLTNVMNSFDPNGFSVGYNAAYSDVFSNRSGQDYVAWCWRAAGYANTFNVLENGSTTSSATAAGAGITAGSLTTGWSVSANRDAGFSIVSYTGNGANATVGHGLNNAPDVVIVKRRTASGSWNVYHSALGNDSALVLQSTSAEITGLGTWGTTSPTSSVFTVGTNLNDTNNYIAYCFAEVAGFSKFGSYVGTGASGNTIVTGFEPAMVIAKMTSSTDNWRIYDNKRIDSVLYPNLSNQQDFANHITFLEIGFTWNTNNSNSTGQEFIYMAFA